MSELQKQYWELEVQRLNIVIERLEKQPDHDPLKLIELKQERAFAKIVAEEGPSK